MLFYSKPNNTAVGDEFHVLLQGQARGAQSKGVLVRSLNACRHVYQGEAQAFAGVSMRHHCCTSNRSGKRRTFNGLLETSPPPAHAANRTELFEDRIHPISRIRLQEARRATNATQIQRPTIVQGKPTVHAFFSFQARTYVPPSFVLHSRNTPVKL